ncbi:MAG: YeeE/YedE family protein [Gammaproteobacteria bacterium]|nr:YeeE/YedE family protein [Gammaproteobacteria bacterium]MBU0884759.1 YeeE/YedE family protein [Gammaproteobacteria bacterium]MBU1861622.1 YeeE/YedE family protein [Gammaproteobacteria bacterium]
MRKLMAFLAGVIFGIGLLTAGMANPTKVLAFLDLAGAWDPSLALVMAAAIGVAFLPFSWARVQRTSLLGAPMQLPGKRELDRRLIGGSLLFGVGWGIAGICPGPAVALLLTGQWQVLVFVAAMLAGMIVFAALERQRS